MRHNHFKFTIKFLIPDDWNRSFIEEYLYQCCDRMYQECVSIQDLLISYYRANTYVAYLTLNMKDYGVPQVGVDLVSVWIEQLYKHADGFMIDTVIIHPKIDPPAKGALIKWDYANDCPIVKVLNDEAGAN